MTAEIRHIEPRGAETEPDTLLRLPAVMAATSLSRAQIYRRMVAGGFPRPVRLTEKRIAWLQSDITRWIKQLPYVESGPKSSLRRRGRPPRT